MESGVITHTVHNSTSVVVMWVKPVRWQQTNLHRLPHVIFSTQHKPIFMNLFMIYVISSENPLFCGVRYIVFVFSHCFSRAISLGGEIWDLHSSLCPFGKEVQGKEDQAISRFPCNGHTATNFQFVGVPISQTDPSERIDSVYCLIFCPTERVTIHVR